MAILTKDEFFKRVQERVGNDTSEEAITFLEDVTDTYADMERRASESGDEWKRKYHELDNSWREKYKHRFFTASGEGAIASTEPAPEPDNDREITIEDLFEEKE